MRNLFMLVFAALFLAACGTVPEPLFKITPEVEVVEETDGEAVAIAASPTPLPPTSTPTAAPTLEPTAAPTLEPTAAPTEAEAAAPAASDDPKAFFVQLANAQRGETLFNQTIDEVGFACATCHNIQGEEIKIGPSLYGVPQRAAERVPGEGPYTYIYNSIYNSQAYIVPGFEQAVHMPHYAGQDGSPVVLSDAQIYDLVAYLMTLNAQ